MEIQFNTSTLEHLIRSAIIGALTNGTSLLAKDTLLESPNNHNFIIAHASANVTASIKDVDDKLGRMTFLGLLATICLAFLIWALGNSLGVAGRAIDSIGYRLLRMRTEQEEVKKMITECVTFARQQHNEVNRSDEVAEEDRDGGLPPYSRAANSGPAIMSMLEQIG